MQSISFPMLRGALEGGTLEGEALEGGTLEGGLTFGHNVPQLEDRHQVVNVTVDALRHTRVLQAQRTRELTA